MSSSDNELRTSNPAVPHKDLKHRSFASNHKLANLVDSPVNSKGN